MSLHLPRILPPPSQRTPSLFHRFRLINAKPKTNDDSSNLGIRELTENVVEPVVTIIFVHGLGGHPVKTWRHRSPQGDTLWPQAWLPQEPGIEGARICIFGYAAGFKTRISRTSTITDFSKALNMELLTGKLADSPIIFVAHSMGGLIVKKAYMLAMQDSIYTGVANAISRGAMVFLGTPHRGSDNAGALHGILSATIGSKRFIEELKRNSFTIEALNEDFRHVSKDLTLWSFYESRPTPIGMGRKALIVDQGSAVLGYGNEGSSQLEGDHRSICKFESREAPGYQTIKDLLVQIVTEKISNKGSSTLSPAAQTPENMHVPEHATELETTRGTTRKSAGLGTKLSEILGPYDTSEENLLFFRDSRVVKGSCEWLFNKNSFKAWAGSKPTRSAQYLWLSGPPAAGKSVLVSAVVDKLQSERKCTTFYFFRRNNEICRTTHACLLSIVAQMSMQFPEFHKTLAEVDAQQARVRSMSTRVLWQRVFIDTLFEMDDQIAGQWYWVIDGLDEADAPLELISLLGKIHSRTPIHIFMTSRTSMEIKRHLQKFVSAETLIQEQIQPVDTKDDMEAHCQHELQSLPFESKEIREITEVIVIKAQGIFLWVRVAVEEILATAHTLEGAYETLEAMPSEMTSLFQQILHGMSKMRDVNKNIAKSVLCSTVCATRPLRTTELQAVLLSTFGQLASLDYTICQVCPHLVKVDGPSGSVQLIHDTVREFLLQCEDSEFCVDSAQAHHDLTQVCLGIWSENDFSCPISSDTWLPRSMSKLDSIHPLLHYSATSCFNHLQSAAIDEALQLAVCNFLRTSTLHWVEIAALLGNLTLLTTAAIGLEASVRHSSAMSPTEKTLMTAWAVDLARIGPKYGRNIISYPCTIHKLLPPFFPVETPIGSRFGSAGDITIVGARPKHWDDCLAHITVVQDGELCRHIVCGAAYLAVTTSGKLGHVVLYDTETCLEIRRLCHGERILCIHMNSTDEYVVTGGLRSMKVWNTKTGDVIATLANPGGARALALAFRPESKSILAFMASDSIVVWDFPQNSIRETRLERAAVDGKYRGSPWGVSFSEDLAMVSLAYKGWPLEIWDVTKVQLVETVTSQWPREAFFRPQSRDIYGWEHGGSVFRYDTRTQTRTSIRVDIVAAACNPSGTLFVTGDLYGVLKFFTADTLELIYKIDKYKDMITGLCFSQDGTKLYDIRSSHCNVWIPAVLLPGVREAPSTHRMESENNSCDRADAIIAHGSSPCKLGITSLTCDMTGDFACAVKSNGDVFLYHIQSGRELQTLYTHGPTFEVQTLAWSTERSLLASVDSARRVIISHLKQDPVSNWICENKNDFTFHQAEVGALKQLLISPDGSRLLLSSGGAHRLFELRTGLEISQRYVGVAGSTPFWLQHPSAPEQILCLELQVARIFSWDTFEELTGAAGIRLKHELAVKWEAKKVGTDAYLTQDDKSIVIGWSTKERDSVVKCSAWNTADFTTEALSVRESRNWHHLRLCRVVGVYRDQVVFIDQDFWVCSSPCGINMGATKHFYLPMDWINLSEERLAVITRNGDFVSAQHGELVVVKRGMRSNHGLV